MDEDTCDKESDKGRELQLAEGNGHERCQDDQHRHYRYKCFLFQLIPSSDTPGIKGFGSIDMQREEVGHYFPEIFRVGRECRFDNCTHTHEPGCAVQEALIKGNIAISRYESYLSLLGDTEESKYR